MCLFFDQQTTNTIKKKLDNSPFIWCYKMIYFDGVRSYAPHRGNRINAGWYRADSFPLRSEYDQGSSLYEGIHIYLTKKEALMATKLASGRYVIKVKCFKKDFLAAGSTYEYGRKNCAIFKKIWIAKVDLKLKQKSKLKK